MRYSCEALIFFDLRFLLQLNILSIKISVTLVFSEMLGSDYCCFFTDVYCIGDWFYHYFSLTPQKANLQISYKTILN